MSRVIKIRDVEEVNAAKDEVLVTVTKAEIDELKRKAGLPIDESAANAAEEGKPPLWAYAAPEYYVWSRRNGRKNSDGLFTGTQILLIIGFAIFLALAGSVSHY